MKKTLYLPLIVCALSSQHYLNAMEIAIPYTVDNTSSLFEQSLIQGGKQLKKIGLSVQQNDNKKLQDFTGIIIEKLENSLDHLSIYYTDKDATLNSKDFKSLNSIFINLQAADKDQLQYIRKQIQIGLTVLALNTDVIDTSFKNNLIALSKTLQSPEVHKSFIDLFSSSFDNRYNINKAIFTQIANNKKEGENLKEKIEEANKDEREINQELIRLKKEIDALQEQNNKRAHLRQNSQQALDEINLENSILHKEVFYNKERLEAELEEYRATIDEKNDALKDINIQIQQCEARIRSLQLLVKANPINKVPVEQILTQTAQLDLLKQNAIILNKAIKMDEAKYTEKTDMLKKSTQDGTTVGNIKRWWSSAK